MICNALWILLLLLIATFIIHFVTSIKKSVQCRSGSLGKDKI